MQNTKRRDQNGEWSGLSVGRRRQRHPKPPPGDKPQPNRYTLSTTVNWVSPLRPTTSGILTARKGEGAAGRGCRKKRKPPCNRVDRATVMVEILNPKGCRLPTGVSSRENLRNHLSEGRQMTVVFPLVRPRMKG